MPDGPAVTWQMHRRQQARLDADSRSRPLRPTLCVILPDDNQQAVLMSGVVRGWQHIRELTTRVPGP